MATRIIPDPGTRQIDGWIGTNWLAEEFLLTPDEIKEVYGVDIGSDYTSYSATGMTGEGKSRRSEEHTSELQSLMRISYAVFCLKKKNKKDKTHTTNKNYASN